MQKQSTQIVPPLKIKLSRVKNKSSTEDENGFRSPRTPHDKNPSQTTPKIFSSPNRYAVLQGTSTFNFDDITTNTDINESHNRDRTDPIEMTASNVTGKKDKIPPIFISNQNLNYKLLCESLIEIVGKIGFYCKTSQQNIKPQANTSDDYRKIIHFLNGQSNARFHTFQLDREKPLRIVIRNLRPSSTCKDIKSALENFNLIILQVVNVRQWHIKIPLPLFFVDLAKDENCKTIFDINSIFHIKIKVEEPHKSLELLQFRNCQDYGHTRTYCSYTPRCVRCAKNHPSSSCDKLDNVPPTCVLCQGNHPSNYRGCLIHKQLQKQRYKPTHLPPPQNVNPSETQASTQATLRSSLSVGTRPQRSYSQATSGIKQDSSPSNINQQTDINSTLNNFISEFRSIITPLISFLTTVISRLIENNNGK
jgi:hypothetical protein